LVGQNEALSLVENLVEKMTKKAYLKEYIDLKDKRISNYELDRKLTEAYNLILEVKNDHEELNTKEFNKDLTGVDGSRTYESDIYGYKIANTNEEIVEAVNGKNIYLTIDTNIQMFAEEAMSTIEKGNPEWATIAIMNAKTGEIF
jgi:cell division protein FtsI/penicillin-binding protein 2